MSRVVEVWVEFASTYSYPAAMTVEDAAAARGVRVIWRPFLLGPIFAAQGLAGSPFTLNPDKGQYMWRDLERICARHGLPFRRPEIFPQNGLRAARIALIGVAEDWGPAFIRAVFRANFAERRDISDPLVLADCLAHAGAAPDETMAQAGTEAVKAALRAQVDRAMALGIFGAPSFTVAGELYWGQDRMAEAIDAAGKD